MSAMLSESLFIASDSAGIELHLQHKRLASQTQFSADNTLVMIHGATYSSASLFDVPVNGQSLMDYLAHQGFNLYALDVRGYGKSSRPVEMEQPADQYAPLAGTAIGVRDLLSAVDFVLARHNLNKVNVFGMSWGGTVSSAFSAQYPDKVNRLALVAPQWINPNRTLIDDGQPLGAYRLVAAGETQAEWLAAAPVDKRDDLIPPGVFEAWAATALGSDPQSHQHQPPKLRAVNGPIVDIRNYWRAGKAMYNPEDIRCPILLVHAEWDTAVPLEATLALFRRQSGAAWRRWVEIGEGTHMILLEKNHLQAWQAVADFYQQDAPITA